MSSLIEPWRDLTAPELERYVGELARRRPGWEHLVHHDPLVRTYEQLHRSKHVDVWLICWSEAQDTGFHDHDVSAGAVAVVSGTVREERLVVGDAPVARTFSAPGRFSFEASVIHRVHHLGSDPAVTLHAYSPPLARLGAYRVGSGGELVRETIPYTEELTAAPEPEPALVA